MYFINDIVLNQPYFKHLLDGDFAESADCVRELQCIPDKMRNVLVSMLGQNSQSRVSCVDALEMMLESYPEVCTEDRQILMQKLKEDPDKLFFESVKNLGFQKANQQRYMRFLDKNKEILLEKGFSEQTIWAIYASGDFKNLGLEY